MDVLRKDKNIIGQNDFLDGVNEVKENKRKNLPYFI